MTRDELRYEWESLVKKRNEIAKTLATPGWSFICEWHRKEREKSLAGLAEQVLGYSKFARSTAALIKASDEILDREDSILKIIDNELASLKQSYQALAPASVPLIANQ